MHKALRFSRPVLSSALSRLPYRIPVRSSMSTSTGVISVADIPSWYDYYRSKGINSKEESESKFDEKLNKRVAIIVGRFAIVGTSSGRD